MKSKLFKLSAQSEADIATIMECYACETEAQAVRLALRILAQSERLTIVLPATPKHGRRSASTTKEHAHASQQTPDSDRPDPADLRRAN